MEWQDVLSVIIFLLLAAVSKKRKPTEKDEAPVEEEPSFSDIDTVRKKIEALKQQRREASRGEVVPCGKSVKERPVFSAYKHLPKDEAVPLVAVPEVIPVMPMTEKPKEVTKSIDLPQKRSRLHDWVVGQVVLGTPAYRRYGNFIHR